MSFFHSFAKTGSNREMFKCDLTLGQSKFPCFWSPVEKMLDHYMTVQTSLFKPTIQADHDILLLDVIKRFPKYEAPLERLVENIYPLDRKQSLFMYAYLQIILDKQIYTPKMISEFWAESIIEIPLVKQKIQTYFKTEFDINSSLTKRISPTELQLKGPTGLIILKHKENIARDINLIKTIQCSILFQMTQSTRRCNVLCI